MNIFYYKYFIMAIQKNLKLYKKVGETPLECLGRFRTENPEYEDVPMTYAGRLDPMAEGLLLVLAGEECRRKEEYLNLDKEYQGEVLFGFETDTGDVLGIPKRHRIQDSGFKIQDNSYSKICANLRVRAEELAGKRPQKYPAFSSKTVEGRPLWQWAREGRDAKRPEREIEVYSFEVVDCREEEYFNIFTKIKTRAGKVKGDFRQAEILKGWEELLSGDGKAVICGFRTKVSSGTYVRVLAEELGRKLGIPATLYSLKRTKLGELKEEHVKD